MAPSYTDTNELRVASMDDEGDEYKDDEDADMEEEKDEDLDEDGEEKDM